MARTTLKKRVVEDSESDLDSEASFRATDPVKRKNNNASDSSQPDSPSRRRPLARLSDNFNLRRQSLTNAATRNLQDSGEAPTSPAKLQMRVASGGRIAGLAAVRAASSLSNSLNGGSLMSTTGQEAEQPGVSKQGKVLPHKRPY
jgi:hypothetical protein